MPMARRRLGLRTLLRAKALVFVVGLSLGLIAQGAYHDWKKHGLYYSLGIVEGMSALSSSDLIKISFWRKFQLKSDIVMIGDSHTDLVDWRAIFPGKDVINRGVSGDTTGAVLARLDTIAPVAAKRAVVMLGSNDVARGVDLAQIERNYRAILARLRIYGTQIIVMSTPFTTNRRHSATIARLNEDLAAHCRAGHCTFVDLNTKIAADGLLRLDRTIDGIHLNGDGYADWAGMLGPLL